MFLSIHPCNFGYGTAGDMNYVGRHAPQGVPDWFAEQQLEGEGVRAVVIWGHTMEPASQRFLHGFRCRTGQRLGVAPVVGETHPYFDGLANIVVSKRVRTAGRSAYVGVRSAVAAHPLVAVGHVVQSVGGRRCLPFPQSASRQQWPFR